MLGVAAAIVAHGDAGGRVRGAHWLSDFIVGRCRMWKVGQAWGALLQKIFCRVSVFTAGRC